MIERSVVVAAAQMHSDLGDRQANLERAEALIAQAVAQGAQLVVLPELFAFDYVAFTHRDPALFERAETLDGPIVQAMVRAARQHKIWIVPTLFERDIPGVCYDTALLLNPDGDIVGRYRKTHIALLDSPESGQEKFFFRPGNRMPVFQTPLGVIGILICYDRGFPEAWRVLALQGAEIVLVPVTTTDEDGFAAMACTRCFENGVFGVFVNRCGQEDWKRFFGGSLIAGPRGEILAQAGDTDALLVARLNLTSIEPTRLRLPYLRDRRPELYGLVAE